MIIDAQIRGQVGHQTGSSGAPLPLGLSKRGWVGTSHAFREAVEAGRCFSVCNQAGVTSQAGLSATTPVLSLYNPASSGKIGILHFAGATFTVAFATAGAIWLAVNSDTAAAATTGTRTTAHRNLKLGGGEPSLTPLLAATLPAAPVGIALLGVGLTGAITTIPQLQSLGRWFNGAVVIQPGATISIQTGVASGASGSFYEFVWEEQDV